MRKCGHWLWWEGCGERSIAWSSRAGRHGSKAASSAITHATMSSLGGGEDCSCGSIWCCWSTACRSAMFISQIDTNPSRFQKPKNYYKLTHTRKREREREREPGKRFPFNSESLVYNGPHVERLDGIGPSKIGPKVGQAEFWGNHGRLTKHGPNRSPQPPTLCRTLLWVQSLISCIEDVEHEMYLNTKTFFRKLAFHIFV